MKSLSTNTQNASTGVQQFRRANSEALAYRASAGHACFRAVALATALCALWMPVLALAQTPRQFAYQGRLTDSNSVPFVGYTFAGGDEQNASDFESGEEAKFVEVELNGQALRPRMAISAVPFEFAE